MSDSRLTGLGALLVSDPVNIRYLTGFSSATPNEREAFALFLPDETILFTNSLYREAALKLKMKNAKLKIIEISREKPIGKQLGRVIQELQIKKLGFEENDLTVAEHKKLAQALTGVTLMPTKDRIEKLRMIKREDEIHSIRQAVKLTDSCFEFILGKLKPRVTEGEIAWEIESFFRKRAAQTAFSPIVAFGSNSSMPHYQSSASCKLTTANLILLDFGARVNGYCADMTRVVFIGKPKDEWRRAYDVVLEAQKQALDLLTRSNPVKRQGSTFLYGISGALLDRTARVIIKKAGFAPYPHSLGHGVGLAIHEAPRLTIKKDFKLKPKMIFTVEPATYAEGKYGIRLEDLVLLKADGLEVLTQTTKQLIHL